MPEAKAVESMFARIAGRYDIANRTLSGGVDIYWRARTVKTVAAHNPKHITDLATGSGDVAFALTKKLGQQIPIAALDFCEPMLEQARQKQAHHHPNSPITFSHGDILNLPLKDESTDAVTIAFGIRNLEDRAAGLKEIHRILRPGGHLHILEFSQPYRCFAPIYYLYLRYILPTLAALLTKDKNAYDYLADTISGFPSVPQLTDELTQAGYTQVTAQRMTLGIVALHTARK